MPTVHARLSPSASHIWLTCSGAIPLIERLNLKDSGSSIYADRGTAMHTVMELCLTEGKRPKDFVGLKLEPSPGVFITIDIEMAQIVDHAVKYVRSIESEGDVYVLFCEEKVEVSHEHGIFGTVDVIVVHDGMLEIVDLKTGRTEVEAVKNTQLMLYAIGAYKEFGAPLGIDQFRVTIVQPLVYSEPQSYDFDLKELLAFEAEVEVAILRTQTHKDTFVPSEKACRWCRARHVCPAQVQMVNELAAVEFKSIGKETPEPELGELFAKAKMVKATMKAVEAEVLRRLVEGRPVKGYRLAPGSLSREWDESKLDKLEKTLDLLYEERLYMLPPKLKSPAQLEKALKEAEEEFDFSEYLESGKTAPPSIVPESSKKPMWSSSDAARMDFAVYKTDEED